MSPRTYVWSTVRKRGYERITLHPKDQRYELVEPARVMSGGPFPLVYGNLIEELRDELSAKQNGKAPVFPFGYDWRLPLDRIEEALASFVPEVIDRTMQLPHYRDDDDYAANPTVNLIGHSMGGLLIAEYIERHGGALVNKVVTLATPFQGSLEAVLKLTTGTADLGDEAGQRARAPHGSHDPRALSPASQLRGQPWPAWTPRRGSVSGWWRATTVRPGSGCVRASAATNGGRRTATGATRATGRRGRFQGRNWRGYDR